eukprot:3832435-Ditylum_brightwellii.AAC.1
MHLEGSEGTGKNKYKKYDALCYPCFAKKFQTISHPGHVRRLNADFDGSHQMQESNLGAQK